MDFTKLWRKGVTAFVIPHVVKSHHCNFRSGSLLVWSSRNQENSRTSLKRWICTDFKATKRDPYISQPDAPKLPKVCLFKDCRKIRLLYHCIISEHKYYKNTFFYPTFFIQMCCSISFNFGIKLCSLAASLLLACPCISVNGLASYLFDLF